MSLSKQAKILTKHQQGAVLSFLEGTRYSDRNTVIFLLSIRAGLRAKEIASIKWGMVMDSEGSISDSINLHNQASKGNSGGVIWLNHDLREALEQYLRPENKPEDHIIITKHGKPPSPQVIVNMFYNWYKKIGFNGCSSHSGRRTFITSAARKISSVGGSIKDVQMLARHSSLNMTQRYIESDIEAQKKVVQII